MDVATYIALKPSGKILLQQRDDGNGKTIPFPFAWVFPGGALEGGETFLAAAVREAKEEFEIDIDVSTASVIHLYQYQSEKEMLYDAIIVVGVSEDVHCVQHEGVDFRWLRFSEIEQYELGFEQWQILPYLKEYLSENRYEL